MIFDEEILLKTLKLIYCDIESAIIRIEGNDIHLADAYLRVARARIIDILERSSD